MEDIVMSREYSSPEQGNLNVNGIQVVVAEKFTTRRIRPLIYDLTGENLSDSEIRALAKRGQPIPGYPQGKLILRPSNQLREGRYWLWDLFLIPNSYLAA